MFPLSFSLRFENQDDQVLLRVESPLGSVGPFELRDEEADQMIELVNELFEVALAAQQRTKRAKAGSEEQA